MNTRTNLTALALGFTTLAVFGAVADAAGHRVTRFGGVNSSFYLPPLRSPADLRTMLQVRKSEVQSVLANVGWSGRFEDLQAAVQTGSIGETRIDSGAHLPFIAYRKNGATAVMSDVVYDGRPVSAFTVEFASQGKRWRLTAPKPCSNFWVESVGAAPMAQAAAVTLMIEAAAEVCVTQSVDVTVRVTNAAPDAAVVVTVDGQQVGSGPATDGVYKTTLPGYNEPGQHQIEATVQGTSATNTASLAVKPCPPTCRLTVTPMTARRGTHLTVDASGSQADPNVAGGLKSVSVDVLLDGNSVEKFELTPPTLVRDDLVLKKAGTYTIRAVATDQAGQASTNPCEATVEMTKPPIALFGAVFVGKERMIRDAFPGGRCAALVGGKFGILPQVADNVEIELSFGVKVNVRDTEFSSVFGDVAVNRLFSKGFVGAGVSAWDLTEKDTRTAALLVQGGVNLTQDGRFVFTVEGRIPFDQFDEIDNNYQFWGGLRIIGR